MRQSLLGTRALLFRSVPHSLHGGAQASCSCRPLLPTTLTLVFLKHNTWALAQEFSPQIPSGSHRATLCFISRWQVGTEAYLPSCGQGFHPPGQKETSERVLLTCFSRKHFLGATLSPLGTMPTPVWSRLRGKFPWLGLPCKTRY